MMGLAGAGGSGVGGRGRGGNPHGGGGTGGLLQRPTWGGWCFVAIGTQGAKAPEAEEGMSGAGKEWVNGWVGGAQEEAGGGGGAAGGGGVSTGLASVQKGSRAWGGQRERDRACVAEGHASIGTADGRVLQHSAAVRTCTLQ